MGGWKLALLFLLTLTFRADGGDNGTVGLSDGPSVRKSGDLAEALLVTAGGGPALVPLCTNETQNAVVLVVCKMRGCVLLYKQESGFEGKCHPGFALTVVNQTVFLRLTSLTPEDSGSYSCECSRAAGGKTIPLNITVEDSVVHGVKEDEDAIGTADNNDTITTIYIAIGACALILATAAILLAVRQKTRRRVGALAGRPNGASFVQRENELYSSWR